MWRLGGTFWTWKDYDAKDHIRERIFNALEEQKQRLLDGFRKLDIHEREDIEPFIDRIAEQVRQAQLKQQNWLKLEPYYTKRELGLRKVREVDPIGDKGGDEIQINRAIQKIGKVSSKVSGRKRRKARELLETIASAGYYGYLVLRRKLGIPLEHPTLRPWYAKFLPWIPQLINPGGIVFLKEGTFSTSAEINLNTSSVKLSGFGWGTKIIPSGNFVAVLVGGSNDVSDIIISDLYLDGSNQDNQSLVRIVPTSSATADNVVIQRCKCYKAGFEGIGGDYSYAGGDDFSNKAFVFDNVVLGSRGSWGSIHPHTKHGWIVAHNYVGDQTYEGIRHGWLIVGNTVKGRNAIIGADRGGVIANNYVYYPMGDAGIQPWDSMQVIAKNHIEYNTSWYPGHGIWLNKNYNIVVGNVIKNLYEDAITIGGTNAQGAGAASVHGNIVEGNMIINVRQGGGGQAVRISDDETNPSEYNIVRNNYIDCSGASTKPDYGIREVSVSDRNIIVGNFITGVAVAGISVVGANTLVRNNFGFSNVKTVTSDYTMKWADEIILANASSAPLKVILPDPAAYPGYSLMIKKVDSSTNAVTVEVADTANQTIDGTTSVSLANQWDKVVVVSDGSNWYIKAQ